MEQNSKYFTKTAEALNNLHQTAELLNLALSEEQTSKTNLQAENVSLRQEIHKEANRIDNIIAKLKGAME